VATVFLVITIPLTGSQQTQNLTKTIDEKGAKQKGRYCKHGQSWQYTGGRQRMTVSRSFLARQVVLNSVQYIQFSMGVLGTIFM
jgi:hypothetical protein